MPGFRMLAFDVWKGRVLSKLLKVFFSFPKILFENIFELTHISKTEQKSCLNFFQVNIIKKLDKNLKRTEKESIKNHFLFKSYKGFNPGTFL